MPLDARSGGRLAFCVLSVSSGPPGKMRGDGDAQPTDRQDDAVAVSDGLTAATYVLDEGAAPLEVLLSTCGSPWAPDLADSLAAAEASVVTMRRPRGEHVAPTGTRRTSRRMPMVHRSPRARGSRRRSTVRRFAQSRSGQSPGRDGESEPPPRRPKHVHLDRTATVRVGRHGWVAA